MHNAIVQRDVETFKRNIQPFVDQWRSLDIRLVAMQDEGAAKSTFQNAATTITLSPSPPNEITRIQDLPDLGWLKTVHEIRPIEDLNEVLSGLATTGILKFGDIEMTFIGDNASTSFYKYQRGEGYTSSPTDWTYYSLMLDSKFALTLDSRKVDEELKGGDIPFLALDELIKEFPLWTRRWEGYRSYLGMLEINALWGIRIADTRWEDRLLRIVIDRMPYWDIKDIDLGLIYTFGSDLKERKSHKIENLALDPERELAIEVSLPGDLRAATIFLRTRRNTVDQATVYNPALNPRLSLYDIFDRSLEKLSSWLSLEGENSRDFEKAIETLLFLCGYSIVPFIRDVGQDSRIDVRGVDCLVLAPEGNLFVVECTTGPVGSDKLEKLRHRNNSLSSLRYQASPILFTTVKRGSVSNDVRKKAQDNKIAIVAREDIEILLSMAKRNAPLDEISRFVYQCIPSSFPPR